MTAITKLSSFRGFYVASVAAALLLAYGIESLVVTIQDPLAEWVVDAANFIIRVGRFQVASIHPISFSWAMAGYTGTGAIAAFLMGFWLGNWARKQATS